MKFAEYYFKFSNCSATLSQIPIHLKEPQQLLVHITYKYVLCIIILQPKLTDNTTT